MEFIKSGIPGLDNILKGGIRTGNTVLITGAPGTGKTILALQFAEQGSKEKNPVLYITTEEKAESLRKYAKSLGLNLEKFEDSLFSIYEQPISEKLISLEKPLQLIKRKKIKRVILDSITLFEYIQPKDEIELRKNIISFLSNMKNLGVTLLATSERSTTNLDNFLYKMQDFLFEGLIILTKIRKGASFERCLHVAKMRGQEHLVNIYPFSIAKGGIKIYPDQLPFSLIDKTVKRK